ncbi:Uncharacterised protein [Lysinibacillus capsici]|uniref:Uncharacterized protein n=1 Tax=Lysinibacillus capsici TaxID=2115968 RepID=A0A2X1AJ10_9BACI|nr:hypothetical protein [Lysinibacillus capsici]SPU40612.1 Uncharacterised protein [Lysinibacillus capsici]
MTELTVIDQKKIWNILNSKTKKNPAFAKEVEELNLFYSRKFVRAAQGEEKQTIATEIIGDIISAQIFHGFFLQHNLIANEKVGNESFLEAFWENPPGITRNHIGEVMQLNFGKDWHLQHGIEKVNVRVLNEIPEAFDIFRDILIESANFGAYKATTESEKYLGTVKHNDEYLFGSPYDIHFINPQIFIQAQYYSNENEIWDVFSGNTGVKESQWLGTVQLIKIPNANEIMYILTVSLSDLINTDEKMQALDLITNKLPKNIRDIVQIRLYHLSDLDTFTIKA